MKIAYIEKICAYTEVVHKCKLLYMHIIKVVHKFCICVTFVYVLYGSCTYRKDMYIYRSCAYTKDMYIYESYAYMKYVHIFHICTLFSYLRHGCRDSIYRNCAYTETVHIQKMCVDTEIGHIWKLCSCLPYMPNFPVFSHLPYILVVHVSASQMRKFYIQKLRIYRNCAYTENVRIYGNWAYTKDMRMSSVYP